MTQSNRVYDFQTLDAIYYRKYSLATPDCFQIYWLSAESLESCSVCFETRFISEQLCMKTFVVVVDAEE